MKKPASRMDRIPPYLFARLDKKKEEMKAKGVDLIDLSIGDPDLPTPDHIVRRMEEALKDPTNHRYPSYEGMVELRRVISHWFAKRFGVDVDPEREVLVLIGSKDGIAHLPWAYLEGGDICLVPSPGYPVYSIATLLSGGTPFFMPLKEERGFLPDLDAVPAEVWEKAKILFLNYPNNPTGAHADLELFDRALFYARRFDLLVAHDAAYSEVTYDGYVAPSVLEVDRSKQNSIEFHSLSKTYCMTGWRIGFAVGNREAVQTLARLKTNIDSGVFQAVQWAAVEALNGDQSCVEEMKKEYQKRRDLVVEGLSRAGFHLKRPLGTFYIWAQVPEGMSSSEFCEKVIEEKGIVVTPGNGFGESGEGYFRISLTSPIERLQEALRRWGVETR